MRKKRAFTLVELLVVISIIALLLSILMPSLSRAREQAKRIYCQTNMRGLTLSWGLYTDGNDDLIPAADNYYNRGLWGGTWGNPWSWAWMPYKLDGSESVPYGGPFTPEERMEGVRRGSIFPYAGIMKQYQCPSDKSQKWKKFHRTYSIADSLNGTYKWHWKPMIYKRTSMKRPSGTFVFIEEKDPEIVNRNAWSLDTNGVGGDGITAATAFATVSPVPVWHNGGGNLSFADGHVEHWKWSKEIVDYFSGDVPPYLVYVPVTPGGLEDLERIKRAWPR